MTPRVLDDIRGLKPFLVGGSYWPAIALVAVLAAILALTAWYLSRRPAEPEADVIRPRPTAARSLRSRLDGLRDSQLLDSSHSLRFCETLHEIVRDLMAQRLGLPARRMTTHETMLALHVRQVDTEVFDRLVDLLETCDRARFGRVLLDVNELQAQLRSAYRLLDLTARAPRPAAEVSA